VVVDADLEMPKDADLHAAARVVVLAQDQPNHVPETRSTAIEHTVHHGGLRPVYDVGLRRVGSNVDRL
jgi:hypothetical protein